MTTYTEDLVNRIDYLAHSSDSTEPIYTAIEDKFLFGNYLPESDYIFKAIQKQQEAFEKLLDTLPIVQSPKADRKVFDFANEIPNLIVQAAKIGFACGFMAFAGNEMQRLISPTQSTERTTP